MNFWVVILAEFDGEEVVAVPTVWLDATSAKCFWPTFFSSKQLATAIKQEAKPGLDWDEYDVLRKYGPYNTYLEARQKSARVVEQRSGSSTDSSGSRKRKIPKKYQDFLSLPKNVCKPLRTLKAPTNVSSLEVPSTSGIQRKRGRKQSSKQSTQISGTPEMVAPSAVFPPPPSPKLPAVEVQLTAVNAEDRVRQQPSQLPEPQPAVASARNPSGVGDGAFEKLVLSGISVIKIRLQNIEDTQSIILEQLKDIRGGSNTRRLKSLKLPVESVQELEILEEKVNSCPEVYSEVANCVDWVGGGDVRKCTNKMLRKLMTDCVAQHFNWKGHNDKRAFESYELCTIVVAIFHNLSEFVHVFFGKITGNEALIQKAVKDWLKAAPTRLKCVNGSDEDNNLLPAVDLESLEDSMGSSESD